MNLKKLEQELFKRGIAVIYIPDGFYTGVPKAGCIRLSIFSNHTREQVDRLMLEINDLI